MIASWKAPQSLRASNDGYLMIEVLVALTISIVGIVGIAKIQHVAKSANAQAIQRTIATNLAINFIERVRANTQAIDNYFTADQSTLKGFSPAPNKLCTATEMAGFDIWNWEQQLIGAEEVVSTGQNAGGLVSPIVCLERPSGGGGGLYQIAIAWHGQSKITSTAAITNSNAAACGADPADNAYDSTGNDNVFRRIHWQEFYIDI